MNQKDCQKKKEEEQRTLYKCDKCEDRGWIIIPRERKQPLFVKCECQNVSKVRGQWKESGIKVDMCKYTFGNYKIWNEFSKMAKDSASSYYMKFDVIRYTRQNSIMFCGQVGSGKTHLAVALSLNLLDRGLNVVYLPYRDVVTSIKQNMLDAEYYGNIINKYQVCDVLLIDDLFKGKINESDINIMFEIINYRYYNCLPIIVSTEFTVDKLLDFDEGVGSRIYEMCKRYVVEIPKGIENNYRLR